METPDRILKGWTVPRTVALWIAVEAAMTQTTQSELVSKILLREQERRRGERPATTTIQS